MQITFLRHLKTRFYICSFLLLISSCFLSAYADDAITGLKYYQKEQYQKAYQYFSKPSAQKNPEVQRDLGYMYLKGMAVKQDYQKAMHWFAKSAEQGNREAIFFIGVMYHFNKGVKQDYTKAAQ